MSGLFVEFGNRHGDFLVQLNMQHLADHSWVVSLHNRYPVCRPAGLLLSLLGLGWASTIYLVCFQSTLAFMFEQEIPEVGETFDLARLLDHRQRYCLDQSYTR